MPRIVTAFGSLTIGFVLAIQTSGALAAEPAPSEPDWVSLAPLSSNRDYLDQRNRVRHELTRFKDDPLWRGSLTQTLATEYSFVGRYKMALECHEEFTGKPSTSSPLNGVADYEAIDAIDTILDCAERYQVIMVNEAHHVPLHRAFTIQLLEGLYRKGFRYFAAEALTAKDGGLQARGYPTIKSGYYLHEPLYADLVRTAMRIGYRVIPYEYEPDPPQAKRDPAIADNFCELQNSREEGQARNLQQRILGNDPRAKILVHAGYAHIGKKPIEWEWNGKDGELRKGEVRLMAYAFQQLSGIEPLSVDQTQMIERGNSEEDHGDYRAARETGLVKEKPVVLRHKRTREFLRIEEMNDLVVLHPRTRYENGRPTWLALGGRRGPYTVRTGTEPEGDSGYLAQAFYVAEQSADAVPVDQIEFTADEPAPTLWLPSGEFQIRIVDESGTIRHAYSTTLVVDE